MSRDSVSQSPFLPWWVWLVPLTTIFLFYKALQPVGNPAEQIVWYSVLIIIAAAALTRVCRVQKQFDLFEPLHLAFALFLIFYPVRALFAVWLDESWFDPARESIWRALSASVLGFVCFALGYKIKSRKPSTPRVLWLDRGWNFKRARVVSLAFLLLALSGFVAVRIFGGSLLYFILVDSDIKSPEDMKPWFFYLLWICVFMQVGALVQLGVWLTTGRETLWTMLYCLLALLSTFLLARYFTVLFLMMLVLSWHYKRRRIKTIQVGILSVLVIGYLGLAGLYREWISPGYDLDSTSDLVELARHQDKLVLRYVVANLEELSNLSEVLVMTPSNLPYQLGSTFAPLLLKPVPRVLLPSKPLGASALFSRELTPEGYNSGLVTGLGAWGEWYMNFSWFGLVFGMTLTGALTAAAYRALCATNELGRVLLYSSTVVVLFTWLRTDFNSATTLGLYYFIPAILALAYITRTKPQTR